MGGGFLIYPIPNITYHIYRMNEFTIKWSAIILPNIELVFFISDVGDEPSRRIESKRS